MAQPFEQTLIALRGDSKRVWVCFGALGALLLVGWLVIALSLPIATSLSSADGSVVSTGADVRLVSNTDTAVEEIAVVLGQAVSRGDPLVRFDAGALRVSLQSKRQQAQRLNEELNAVRAQLGFLEPTLETELQNIDEQLRSSDSRRRQALSRIDYAKKAQALYAQLRSERRIDKLQYEEAVANLAQEELELKALEAEVAQLRAQRQLTGARVQGGSEELRAQVAEQERVAAKLQGEIRQLELEIEDALVRAPTAATVGAIADIAVGGVPGEQAWLLTLVPEQSSEFRAYFDAQQAGGRIQPGQPARIALTALPWVEHGTHGAEVVRVASVPKDDRLEVILSLDTADSLHASVRQGYKGRVSVEVSSLTLMQRFWRLLSAAQVP